MGSHASWEGGARLVDGLELHHLELVVDADEVRAGQHGVERERHERSRARHVAHERGRGYGAHEAQVVRHHLLRRRASRDVRQVGLPTPHMPPMCTVSETFVNPDR
jgi:hypothetical protein